MCKTIRAHNYILEWILYSEVFYEIAEGRRITVWIVSIFTRLNLTKDEKCSFNVVN